MYSEDDLIPISALQHLAFCERQCALIHVEGVWMENRFTAEGRGLHEKAHEGMTETRGDVRITRGLRLQSLRLGLVGQADVVEFHRLSPEEAAAGVALRGAAGRWKPFPVEYKRGRPKPDARDKVQLCAQALCLEEMLEVSVPLGALYYGKPRRREDVPIDQGLREETERLAARLHRLLGEGLTPPARYSSKCDRCSLYEACRPKSVAAGRSASRYVAEALEALGEEEG